MRHYKTVFLRKRWEYSSLPIPSAASQCFRNFSPRLYLLAVGGGRASATDSESNSGFKWLRKLHNNFSMSSQGENKTRVRVSSLHCILLARSLLASCALMCVQFPPNSILTRRCVSFFSNRGIFTFP